VKWTATAKGLSDHCIFNDGSRGLPNDEHRIGEGANMAELLRHGRLAGGETGAVSLTLGRVHWPL
jgi:hypothetical protein